MEQMLPALSVAVAVLALVCTTVLLAQQVRQMEHENIYETFRRLGDVSDRYPSDEERWETIRPIIERLRRVRNNPFILENFEWLAMYSAWWKDVPHSPRETNYRPTQFRDVVFRV